MTTAPSSANRSTTPRPMPRDAPVTSATLPSILMLILPMVPANAASRKPERARASLSVLLYDNHTSTTAALDKPQTERRARAISARVESLGSPKWRKSELEAADRRRREMGPLSVETAQAGGFGGWGGGGRRRRRDGSGLALPAQSGGWRHCASARSYAALPMGGDTRSQRVEAHGDYLLRLHRREPDLTLAEICARLERTRGEKVSPSNDRSGGFSTATTSRSKKVGARE